MENYVERLISLVDRYSEATMAVMVRLPDKFIRQGWLRFAAATLTILAIVLCIFVARMYLTVYNTSLAYLIGILWIAVSLGRRYALWATLVACVAHYLLFVPVNSRTTAWFTFPLMLALAWCVSTVATLTRKDHHNVELELRKTEMLQDLTILVGSATDYLSLEELAARVLKAFKQRGVECCSIIIRDKRASGSFVECAARYINDDARRLLHLTDHSKTALEETYKTMAPIRVPGAFERVRTPGAPGFYLRARFRKNNRIAFYVPLISKSQVVVGALGIAGKKEIATLLNVTKPLDTNRHIGGSHSFHYLQDDHRYLEAFTRLIASALEGIELRRSATTDSTTPKGLMGIDQADILFVISHELKMPLATIRWAIESGRDDLKYLSMSNKAEARNARRRLEAAFTTIEKTRSRLYETVDKLMSLGKLREGGSPPQKQYWTLDEIVSQTQENLSAYLPARFPDIVFDEPDSPDAVYVDCLQIAMLLTNLAENALKYSPAQTPVRVSVTVREIAHKKKIARDDPDGNTHELVVCVADHGRGIALDEIPKVFRPYYRITEVSKQPRSGVSSLPADIVTGIGLGLAICESIARAHGGRITIVSDIGVGSTITVTIPTLIRNVSRALSAAVEYE